MEAINQGGNMDPNDVPNTSPLNDDNPIDWNVPMASDDIDSQAAEDVVSNNAGAPQESDDPMEKDGEEMPQP